MLYSCDRTHLRVFHSKDLISSEQQQKFHDQNSVEEHLKLLEYPRNSVIDSRAASYKDWYVQDVQNFLDNLRTKGDRLLCLEIVLPKVTMFIPSDSLWYLIVLVNRFKPFLHWSCSRRESTHERNTFIPTITDTRPSLYGNYKLNWNTLVNRQDNIIIIWEYTNLQAVFPTWSCSLTKDDKTFEDTTNHVTN